MKMYAICNNVYHEILEGYTSKEKALARLFELCKDLKDFKIPVDFETGVLEGYFDRLYSIEEVEIKD